MKETGILFTPDNIRAIPEGRKTQARRVVTPQPTLEPNVGFVWKGRAYGRGMYDGDQDGQAGRNFVHKCPYGGPGDCLYIKEGIITHVSIPALVGYYMDGCRVTEHWEKRLTAMFMPKWAARTWLEITEVRVERLQDISEEDAKAEGAPAEQPEGAKMEYAGNWPYMDGPALHRYGFQYLWDSINAKKHPWASNPFVWAITFRDISGGEGADGR